MPSEEFLAKIRLGLEGKEQVVGGLQEAQQAVQKLASTKVTTTFDKAGLVTGKQVSETFRNINDNVTKTTPMMEQLGRAMARALIVAPVWMLLRSAMMSVTNLIQDQIKFTLELETAMARIRIVGKGTSEEFTNLKDSLIALSLAYGVTAIDAINAAQIFAQQGKTVAETLYLTQQAMLAAQVLGQDVKTTVDDLTAAMKGFNIPMSQSTGIIDKWIGVEKEFAVTSKDLAEATKAAGATAHQMGLSISEFLGDVTAVIEVTRKSGSEAARALSFVYVRLLTSAQPVVEKLAQIKFYLDEQGKSTNALTGVLRPAADILEELAIKYSTLEKEEKLQIASAVASKRQMTVFNALMQNYNTSLNARVKALSSAGTAETAFGIIQETAAFKIKQVSSAWNNMTNALTDTSAFKTSTDAFKDFLNNITLLINVEKGFRASIVETVTAAKQAAETQFTMATNFKEVIALRDKLLSAPPSDDTTERIKILNDAIKSSIKKSPSFKLALDAPTPEEFNRIISDIQKAALRQRVILDVSFDYDPKIIDLQTKIEKSFVPGSKAVAQAERDIIVLQKAKTEEIENQYRLALGEYELKKGFTDIANEEVDDVTELTDKDKELLDIERKLLILKSSRNIDTDSLIQKEIELVSLSKYSYTEYEKTKKLEELQNELLTERLKLRKDENDLLIDQTLDLAKIRGASSAQLVLAEIALKAASGNQKQIDILKQRYEIEKLITKEKLNQVEVGDEALTLYRVSKEKGVGVARELGKFITGQMDFKRLKEMPDIFAAFKEFFSSRYESLQAAEYLGIPFRGNGTLGGPRQRGEGYTIPIPEFQALDKLPATIAQISKPTTISGLNITVQAAIEDKDTKVQKAQKIVLNIAEAIRTDPTVQKAIEEQIDNF